MTDEIIKELWEIKDNIAKEYGYNIDALVTYFQEQGNAKGRQVIDLRARKNSAEWKKNIPVGGSG